MNQEESKALIFFRNNCPMTCLVTCEKKKKKCCKEYKKGDRCKKCPGRK